jgi:hypothetical protein
LIRFPFIKVYLKPIDTDVINTNSKNSGMIIDEKYKTVRIGAMEVQIASKQGNINNVELIHSKLSSSTWPSISNILNKITKFLPKFSLISTVYDKEEGINEKSKDTKNISTMNSEEFLFSKYENIKVNLYYINHPQIKEYSNIANDELESILNPRKRIIKISEQRKLEKESFSYLPSSSKIKDSIINSSRSNFYPKSARSDRSESMFSRPFTGRSIMNSNIFNNQSNILSTRVQSANRLSQYSFRPLSTLSNLRTTIGSRTFTLNNLTNEIEEKETYKKLKGQLIRSSFTDKAGNISFLNIPYDTYILEIEDSKNFQHCGCIIKINKSLPKENESSLATIRKFIGLRRQINAYVEIYIYYNIENDSDDFNMQLISGSEAILRRSIEGNPIIDNTFFDDNGKHHC